MEISTKTHFLELSTMIHVVRKQIRYMLVNEPGGLTSLGLVTESLGVSFWASLPHYVFLI